MIVYQMDPNGYYIGQSVADRDPMEEGRWLIPAGAVTDEVLSPVEGYRIRWSGGKWTYERLPPPPEPAPEPEPEPEPEFEVVVPKSAQPSAPPPPEPVEPTYEEVVAAERDRRLEAGCSVRLEDQTVVDVIGDAKSVAELEALLNVAMIRMRRRDYTTKSRYVNGFGVIYSLTPVQVEELYMGFNDYLEEVRVAAVALLESEVDDPTDQEHWPDVNAGSEEFVPGEEAPPVSSE